MSNLKMPNLLKSEEEKTGLEMPNLLKKGAGTQKAPQPSASLTTEAWQRATPSQTKIPVKVQQNQQSGRSAGKTVEKQTITERLGNMTSGAMKQWGGSFVNALGTTQAVTGGVMRKNSHQTDKEQLQRELARYEYEAAQADTPEDRTYWEMEAQKARQSLAMREQGLEETKTAGQAMQKKADALSEAGAADIQQAKQGLGKVGSTLVDIGAAGIQMGADIGTGLLTGGSALVPMAVRGFGGASQEARQDGATLGQQVGYGLGSAAVSVATEKLSNVVKPFAKAFGAGVSDDLVESAISRAVSRAAKTAAGKTALEAALRTGAGFLGEGTEEFLEDVANPILKRMTYDPSAQFDLEEAAYDFLIGGALGGLGGAVEGVTGAKGKYQGYQTEVQNTAIDNAYDTMKEKGMFSQEARRAVRDAEDIMPKLDPGGNIAWGQMMRQVAPEKQEAFAQAREIANRFGVDLMVDKLSNGAAGEYQNNRITIDPTAENPVRQVLVHELTHHMETSGLYNDFSQKILGFIAEDMGVDVENLTNSIIQEYGQYGVELDADGAGRELVAKFAEDKLFRDERSIQRLLQTDRNLFQQIYDWIRDTIAKVKGTSEEQFLIDAQRLYEKALRQAGTQQGAGTAQNTFAGVNARTADLNALSEARELERQGAEADAIRRQTGWYRGMDGKWRFEIDDSGMQYDRQGFTENPDMIRRRALESKMMYGDMTQAEFDELRSLTAATRGVVKPSKLGDYIKHDALFAAYPELKDVNVRLENLEMGENGYFDPKRNTVVLNTFLWSQPEDVIVHEVQHAIQQAEGFAKGANPGYWEDRINNGLDIRENDQRIQNADAEYRRIFDQAPEDFKNKIRELNRAVIAKDYDTVMAVEDELYASKYADLYSELSMADFVRRGERGEKLRASDLYRNTAGEIEARDAAARRQLMPEQRELKMPTLGDENTVFADQAGTARDYIPGVIGEDVVLQGIQEVAGMEPVAAVKGTEFAKGDVDLVTQVTNYFDSLGNMVFNPQLGDVKLSRSGAKSDIGHGIGRKKAAAFAAVPSVLENGRVIDYQTNWKGRGYDTAVVAAPITIQGENYLAGVVLTRSQKENSFYLHEVLLTEKGTTPFKTGGRKSGNPGGDVPSVLSLLRQVQDVKNNRSTDDIMPKLDSLKVGDAESVKARQFQIIQENNPAGDDYHTWIRSAEEIKTFEETLRDPDWDYDEFDPDYSRKDAEKAVRTGEITVYSSYPIQQGTFVSPSRMEAESYARNGKVYQKTVKLSDVAWIDPTQGQYASVGQFSMGRSFSELVQNQRDGVEPGTSGQMGISGFDQGPRAGWTQFDLELERRSAEKRAESQRSQQAAKPTAVERLGGPRVVGDQGNYTNTDFLRGADQGKKDTIRARRQAEARLQPTRSEKLFAKGIANRDYTVEDIPASMRRATVTELADYYAAENSYKAVDGVRERGRQIREQNEQMAAELFKDEGGFKPISMLKMNERTPERVMRNIFGDRQGELINEKYIYPVQQNEAGKMRFIQRQLDAVRTFEDSQGQRSELTKAERAIVQQIMEDRFVEETVASMEVAQGIRNAAENIRMGKDPVDTAREFSLNAEERGLAQQLARWMQNQEWLESGELDSVKINNAVQKYAEQYDLFYDAVNDFLTAHGYGTIGFIKGYAPHMQGVDTQNKLLSALRSMGVNTDASSLPTSISGLTADYKPGKRWNPFFQSRVGDKTDYDVAKGYESYVSYLGDIFYHTDDIARLRGVSRYLRKTYGPEEINNAIDHAESLRYADLRTQTEVLKDAGKISEGTKLTYEDARAMMDEYIDELYDNVTKVTKYGEFVKYIDNYANLLAGKQSMADRGMEYMAGRTSLNAGNKLVAAFGRAQVAGNVSSVLNQSSQLAQIAAEVDGKYIAQAAADLAKSTKGKLWNIKETQLFDQSDLLTGKKGIEYLTADDSKFDRMVSAMFKPADIMDSMVSALAVQSKYNQLVAEGTPSEVAMLEADRWATQIMASRMKGSRPMAFESKNVVNQMLHMFQVEAMNSWEHLSQDLPYKYRNIEKTHGKKAATRAVATVVTRGLVSAFLLNRAAEAVYGGTPAPFDVLGYIANFVSSGFGMTTNEALKQMVNAGWKAMFGEGLLGDDDEKELRPFDLGAAASDTAWNISNDIPFFRNAAGLLGMGDQTMPLANMAEAVQGVGKALTAEEKSAGEIGWSLLELGSTTIPGGRQIQKTAQGINTMLQGGRTYGFGDKQRMQYPVEQTPGKWAQAVLFGNSGLSETREFYASGDSGLTAKQTRTVQQMAAEGSDRTKVYETIQSLRRKDPETGDAPDTREKMARLNAADLSDREKLRIYQETIATSESKRPETFRQLMNMGMSWAQVTEAYTMYLDLNSNDNMAASEKATRFASWADRQNLTSDQRAALKDSMAFYSQAKAEAGRYTAMTEAGLDSNTAEGMALRISQLRPEAGKKTVSNLQRYEAVVQYRGLTEEDQLNALESMMEDTEFEKLEMAYAAGISPAKFLEFKRATDGLSADKVFGKTVSGSKKAKVLAAIDAMDISNIQKTALYYAAGYKESTLDDAPWISGKSVGRSREEALKILQGSNMQTDDIMPKLTAGGGMPTVATARNNTGRVDDIMPKLVK